MAGRSRKKLPSAKRPPSSVDNHLAGQKKRITALIEESPGGTKSETLRARETKVAVCGGAGGARSDASFFVDSQVGNGGADLEEAAAKLATMTGYRDSMTIEEKAQLGIKLGLEKKLAFEKSVRDRPPLSSNNFETLNHAFTVAGFVPTDRALNIDPKLETNTVAKSVEVYMERLKIEPLSEFTFETPEGDLKAKEEGVLLARQRREREPFVTGSSKRVQAASGAWNSNIHRVPGQPAEGRATNYIMDIEQPMLQDGPPQSRPGFGALLESAKESGYRAVDVKWINFRVPKDLSPMKEFGGELEPEPQKRQITMVPEVILRPLQRGGFRLLEVEIEAVPWLIIELETRLADVPGKVPNELDPMPTTWLRIAALKEKVSTMPIPDLAPEAQDKSLRLRFARDGVPLFLTCQKTKFLPPSLQKEQEDYFRAADVRSMRVASGEQAKKLFWAGFVRAANRDRNKWKKVQENMAMGYCIVDLELEGPWVKVAPTKPVVLPPRLPDGE
ncbi:hypothetical protein ACHAQA_004892 [Verticillium albo-atrum]